MQNKRVKEIKELLEEALKKLKEIESKADNDYTDLMIDRIIDDLEVDIKDK